MAYNTTEAVAKFLSGFQMKITNRERDTVAPDYYVKYSLTLSKGGKDFSTTFVSDGEPTVTQVFSALADDALTLRKYSTDEFVDKLYAQGVKPSAALRAYDSCKETNLWMQDELYLSGWEIEEISKTLTKYEDEVNTLVEKAASERAVRYAYDHPKDDAEHPYQRYEVKATDLTHALKVAQDSYKAEKAAERAAAKDGVSLAGEARDMETGKDALAGDDPAKSTKSRTGQDIAQ